MYLFFYFYGTKKIMWWCFMVKYRVIVIKLPSCDMDKITPDCCGFLYINHLNLILIYSLIINDVCLLCKTRCLKEGETATVSHEVPEPLVQKIFSCYRSLQNYHIGAVILHLIKHLCNGAPQTFAGEVTSSVGGKHCEEKVVNYCLMKS